MRSRREPFGGPHELTEADYRADVEAAVARDVRSRQFSRWLIVWPCCVSGYSHPQADALQRLLEGLRVEDPDWWADARVVAATDVEGLGSRQWCPTHTRWPSRRGGGDAA